MVSRYILVVSMMIVSVSLNAGCSTKPESLPRTPLLAPSGTLPTAATFLKVGSERFAVGQWEAAKVQFEQALKAQPDLAEAHYDLALTLERLGDSEQARQHYIEAANLAPGHKIIWDSPPLRRYGNVPDKPANNASAPVLPSLGGGGGLGGFGGAGS
ncbi:MAG: tetratricopeptide repeat protein [Nitrospirales bacterium]|nr:tetratricopeptide repeat protein [Nitrospira sp.]MDR4503066.1 tetratricopeptide repeat protein [Nitrospirales bacterium]